MSTKLLLNRQDDSVQVLEIFQTPLKIRWQQLFPFICWEFNLPRDVLTLAVAGCPISRKMMAKLMPISPFHHFVSLLDSNIKIKQSP